MDFINIYKTCNLCAHRCGVDRTNGKFGRCKMGSVPKIARAALHQWEEPIISGTRGSGAIFFSGCSLDCIFCQNRKISHGGHGVEISEDRLSEIMLNLEREGAHNINFVTPTHFVPSVITSVNIARNKGIKIPVVYNTSSYETVETVRILKDTVDVYLADFKYYSQESARELSNAPSYTENAKSAIGEMVLTTGLPVFENSLMKRGVIVRILLLPGHVAEAKLTLSYLLSEFGDDIYISLMNQYTPMPNMPPPLNRKVIRREYDSLCDYALKKGLKNVFFQEESCADEKYIPPFDFTGVF